MNTLKLLFLNPDTNEVIIKSPDVIQAEVDDNPRRINLVLSLHGMPADEFKKLAMMVVN